MLGIYYIALSDRTYLFSLLHRVPCRSGTCTTPIGVTAPQLMACDLFPLVAIKALLYPGAIANALVKNEAIPSYNNLKLHDPSAVKAADAMADLQRLEVSMFIAFLSQVHVMLLKALLHLFFIS